MYKVKILKDSTLEKLEKRINNFIENSAHEYIATLVYDTYDISL